MSFATPTPDLAGFGAAQANLRKQFGRDVRFYGPADVIWDPSIPASAFDDEGFPLDPLASGAVQNDAGVAIAGLTIVGSAQCLVVFRPLQTSIMRRDETYENALAIRSGINKDLILDPSDASQATGASHYMIGTLARDASGNIVTPQQFTPEDGELWKIVNSKMDNFGPVERFIIYGQGTI